MIYGYVVGGHRERGNVCYATPWSLRLLPDTPSFTGLLCTKNQMCQEAGIVLYEQNTFVTILHAEAPVLFQRQNTAAHPFSRVRDLVIHLELRRRTGISPSHDYVPTLLQPLRACLNFGVFDS
jgi:hypothetical protein